MRNILKIAEHGLLLNIYELPETVDILCNMWSLTAHICTLAMIVVLIVICAYCLRSINEKGNLYDKSFPKLFVMDYSLLD